MTLYAFDGASMFDLATAKAHGAIAASVYIVGNPGGLPHATKTRVDAILAAGLGAYANWERAANYFQTCSLADAQAAGAEGAANAIACGFEAGAGYGVGFSFDFDCPASLFPEMGAKINRVKLGLAGRHHCDVYAQQSLIDWLVFNHFIDGKHWLMMSTFGQPYRPTDPNVCMVQGHDLAGNWIQGQAITGTDINTVADPYALRCKWPAGSPYSQGGLSMADMNTIQAALTAIKSELDMIYRGDDNKPGVPETHPANMLQMYDAIAALRAAVANVPTMAQITSGLTNGLAGVGVTLSEAQLAQIIAAIPIHSTTAFDISSTVTPRA